MQTADSQERLGKLSRFCEPYNWAKGSLDHSTYRAFCKFAHRLFNRHPPSVLEEVARLIERAGDSVKPDKLIEQFSRAFAFVAEQRAAESLGALEFIKARSKWPEPEPKLIESIRQAYSDCTLGWWEKISPRG